MMRALLIVFAATGLWGCGNAVGEACEVTGDGFTRRDPCTQMCLAWSITCPDGREVTPNECAGELCSAVEACPEGQVCLQVDSVPANARCVREAVCAPPEG